MVVNVAHPALDLKVMSSVLIVTTVSIHEHSLGNLFTKKCEWVPELKPVAVVDINLIH